MNIIADNSNHESNGNQLDRTRNQWRDDNIASRQQGMVWRAIGNMTLNNVQVWFITLSCVDTRLHWIDKHSILRQNVPKLLRMWRYRVNGFDYALIVSGGESGRNPHYHIVANAPLPEAWQCDSIDSDCEPFGLSGDIATETKKLARYSEKNMRQDSEFTSQSFRRSKGFYSWANPLLKHLFVEVDSSVYVYITNSTKTSFNHSASNPKIPLFKECRFCHAVLPETHNYFIKNGSGYRGECRHCNTLYQKAIRANRNHSQHGSIEAYAWLEYCLARRVKGLYRDDYTSELIPIESVTLDHMTAIVNGGSNSNANACLTSADNNNDKGAMSFEAYIRLQYSLGKFGTFTGLVDCRNVARQQKLFVA